jgi:chromosome segregation ATPase
VVEVKMALKGKSVCNTIEEKLNYLKDQSNDISSNLSSTENKINSLVITREEYFGTLAKIYLPELDAESIKSTITSMQSNVQSIFMAKQKHRKELEAKIDEHYKNKEVLNNELSKVTAKIDDAKTKRDTLKEEALGLLHADETYKSTVEEATGLHDRVAHNTQRLEEMTAEVKQKLPAFETDKLFQYLLGRNFGTASYIGSGLAKTLDEWAAKKSNYLENKKSYDILNSMPNLMSVLLDSRKEKLEKLVAIGKDLEQTYSDKTGLTAIVKTGKALAEKRSKILAQIDENDSLYTQYSQDMKGHASTKDEYHVQAVQELKGYLQGQDLTDLKKKARETPSDVDDGIVDKIENVDSLILQNKSAAKELHKTHDAITEKYDALNGLLSKYRREDYDDSDSMFKSGLDIDDLLTQFLAGKILADNIWSDLTRHHYVEEPPRSSYSSSSSSYGGSHSSSSDSDSHSSSGSSWGHSSGGGFGGGGFGSGGGFGGGGFSSGRGF